MLGLLGILATPTSAAPLSPKTPAPTFNRRALDGRPLSLAAYRGKVVLLDFWASWCAPCIVEIPHFVKLQAQYVNELQVIGISMDDQKHDTERVVADKHINYPIIMGDTTIGRLYGGILGLPELYLIGRDGKIIKSWRGELHQTDLDAALEAVLTR